MDQAKEKKAEFLSFLFITIILFPAVAVMFVGGFGFAVWISQIISG